MKKLNLLILVIILTVSCSKEERAERNLWKDGGTWKTKSLSVQLIINSQLKLDTMIYDAGDFVFKKDGTGSFPSYGSSWSGNDVSFYNNGIQSCKWFNFSGDINLQQEAFIYPFKKLSEEKNTLKLSSYRDYSVGSNSFNYSVREYHTYELEKR